MGKSHETGAMDTTGMTKQTPDTGAEDWTTGPDVCGDLGLRIDRNGVWFYHGSPILRKEMVCLFASVLRRDRLGRYWLVTPGEKGIIEVEDVPFIAVEMAVAGCGRDQVVSLRTNVDQTVTLDGEHPLTMRAGAGGEDLLPYVLVRDGLEAKLARSIYYDLVGLGFEDEIDGERVYGLWSSGIFFPLGRIDPCD